MTEENIFILVALLMLVMFGALCWFFVTTANKKENDECGPL